MKLTDEQQAIVNHDEGAARVFAVAGAGKTTAMVHRIRRLVRESIFAPSRILASSFSRGTVASLETALKPWSACRAVKTQTLHRLGYGVIRKAWDCGYLELPQLRLEPDKVNLEIYHQAIREVRLRNLDFKDELENLDQEDFLAYVSHCKGKLHYADLSRVVLLPDAPHRTIAQPAQPPSEALNWYLDLYRVFEEIRDRHHWIGFDDMLMTGWQLLVQHPDLLNDFQQQFDCILVDEFQDVNRAQFGMLDLLTRPHLNYMVIGDDDQTIYEWRGAEVRFMLKEFDRYQPTNYQITDNFRCKASQITLANAVICHNRNRYTKQLSLTQGFDGCTQIHPANTLEQIGQNVVDQVKASLDQNIAPSSIAILVRVYAQTPYIEQYLIKENIPYWGADLIPFYRRTEILNFLAYAQLSQLETILSTQLFISEMSQQEWIAAWNRVKLIPPLRYLSKSLKEQIQRTVTTGRGTLSQTLLALNADIAQERTARTLRTLAQWLMTVSQQDSAQVALEQLDACISYREHLRQRSGSKETGQGKAAGVDAMITYAKDKGDLFTFLEHLEQLQQQAEQYTQNPDQCIRLTTIHQSKGLEWNVVIVPHCNNGIIPFGENLSSAELEEERRLLYVAMTRSKQELHLHLLQQQPISSFLQEAQAAETLKKTEQLYQQLQTDPQTWRASEVASFVKSIATLGLDRYFRQWWTEESERKRAIATTIHKCFSAALHYGISDLLGLEAAQMETWMTVGAIAQAHSTTSQSSSPPSFPGLEPFLEPTKSKQKTTFKKQSDQLLRNELGRLKQSDIVEHPEFGQGVVIAVENRKVNAEEVVTVSFEMAGNKRIQITKQFCSLRLIHHSS